MSQLGVVINPAELRSARERKRLTRLDLAGLTGLSESMIRNVEKGRNLPGPETLDRMLQVLGPELEPVVVTDEGRGTYVFRGPKKISKVSARRA